MTKEELLTIVLSSTVISTCITTFLSPIQEWIKRKFEEKKIEKEREYNDKKELQQKVEKIYVDAIRIIQLIRIGFSDRTIQRIRNTFPHSQFTKNKIDTINKNIQEINELLKTTAPLMKIYSTDEIYNIFSDLNKYGIYSYSDKVITQSMLYLFDRNFTYMCKAMQKNLGLRFDTIQLPEPYTCPRCGHTHNAEENCPNCLINWVDAVDIEDNFIEEFNNDTAMKQLLINCAQKGYNPFDLLSYPLDKAKWKKTLQEIENTCKKTQSVDNE